MTTTPSVSTSQVTSPVLTEKYTGRVKWFNNKAGYGFITVTDGSKTGTDIFVHHSSIRVDAQQYKYLVEGEYTEFTLSSMSNSAHEFQAGDVSGIKGGKLMCETRHETRSTRTNYKSSHSAQPATEQQTAEWVPVNKPRQQAVPSDQSVRTGRGPSAGRGRGPSAGRGRGPSAGRGRGPSTGRGGRA